MSCWGKHRKEHLAEMDTGERMCFERLNILHKHQEEALGIGSPCWSLLTMLLQWYTLQHFAGLYWSLWRCREKSAKELFVVFWLLLDCFHWLIADSVEPWGFCWIDRPLLVPGWWLPRGQDGSCWFLCGVCQMDWTTAAVSCLVFDSGLDWEQQRLESPWRTISKQTIS